VKRHYNLNEREIIAAATLPELDDAYTRWVLCWNEVLFNFFYRCALHSDIYTVHSPTNALFIKLEKVDYVKISFFLLFISSNLNFILNYLFYLILYSNYCVISKSCFYAVYCIWTLISFEELRIYFMSACLTKTSFLVSFWRMACPLTW
jgi:hypothetical protein